MNVEIWSDFVCPFCYIGKRRFEEALQQFSGKSEVNIVFRSFELDPDAPRDAGHDVHDMLAAKYGMSREQAKAMNANVDEQARSVGLTYHTDTRVLTNTLDAHRLTHFAARHGKGSEMAERLFRAHFTESKHIGDHDTLAALAAEAGLDRSGAAAMLAGGEYAQEVRGDEREAASLGVRGVPFFVIDRKYAVSGAQPSEVFLNALEKAWSERSTLTVLNESAEDAAEAACEGGACAPSERKS
ncbi:DsbA family oxidoreductase [Paenibacillus hamazuiensis]|uniref:DsbA family oxidoreductase n=1 Tax=Paenibacillus hamazuiensis TaxID=2936508 RepID=UPI00200D9A1F|nr:DsbA family oxidoreductase [Paenibacillus hamazuiensis]